jgi:hypothetical protein
MFQVSLCRPVCICEVPRRTDVTKLPTCAMDVAKLCLATSVRNHCRFYGFCDTGHLYHQIRNSAGCNFRLKSSWFETEFRHGMSGTLGKAPGEPPIRHLYHTIIDPMYCCLDPRRTSTTTPTGSVIYHNSIIAYICTAREYLYMVQLGQILCKVVRRTHRIIYSSIILVGINPLLLVECNGCDRPNASLLQQGHGARVLRQR